MSCRLLSSACLTCVLIVTTALHGQSPTTNPTAAAPQPGDSVQVSFAGTWLEAKVLKVEGPRVQAKLASGMEKWFDAGQYRLVPKVDPKFYTGLAVGSKVLARDGNRWRAATVKQREPDRFFIHYDGTNDVRDQWLAADNVRPRAEDVAAFTAPVAGGAGGGPASTPGVLRTAAGAVLLGDLAGVRDLPAEQDVDWAVKPDPAPNVPGIGAGPYALNTQFAAGERVERLQFAGAEAIVTLATEEIRGSGKSRLVRVSLTGGQKSDVTPLPAGRHVMDVSPDGKLILCRGTVADVPNCLTISPIGPGSNAVGEFAWKPHEPRDNEGELPMAALVDAMHVVSCDAQGELVLWELPRGTQPANAVTPADRPHAVYRLKVSPGVKPLLSPGRTTIVALVKDKLRFFDALSGAPLGAVADVPGTNASIAFNAAATLISVTGHQRVSVVDLSAGRIAREIPLPPKFLRGRTTATAWLPSGHLLLGERYLVSPSQRLVIWGYLFPRGTKVESYGGTTWFVAGDTGPLSLCSVKLPDDQAKAAAPPVEIEDLLVFRKGDAVSIDLSTDAPADVRDTIRASLEKQVKAMGLTVGGNGPVHIIASTTAGETRDLEYRLFGRGVRSVSVTEKIHTVRVELDGKEVWKTTSRAGASFMVSAKQGQSLDDAIREEQNRSYNWLATVTVPRDLVRPEGYDVAGVSRMTATGIEAVKVGEENETPPARRPRP